MNVQTPISAPGSRGVLGRAANRRELSAEASPKRWMWWVAGALVLLLLILAIIGAPRSSDYASGGWDASNQAYESDMALYDANGDEDGEFVARMPQAPAAESRATARANDSRDEVSNGEAAAAQQRHIIRRAEIQLRIDEYDAAYTELVRLANETEGYISDSSTTHRAKQTSHANITLRIPAAHFDATLAALRQLGEVESERIESDDITQQFVDTQARIKNAQQLESRLLEMLASHSGSLADVLRLESELSRVRERIERMQAQIRAWSQLTSLTTIRVRFTVVVPYEPGRTVEEPKVDEPTFGSRVSDTWSSSVTLLSSLGEAIALGFIAIVPWLPFAVVLGLVGIVTARRKRTQQHKQQATNTAVVPSGSQDQLGDNAS